MRLTLRTLLAYLDDTLDPAEAKAIGEKVSESDLAPDLIDRIKRVTRRRGLAAPPVGGEGDDAASDPNIVSEYLDNVLPADQLGEMEQSALESDAYLAEISACHQILTLVLSEPARVPPTARQRMYRLVKGRESIPYRKAAVAGNVAGVVDPLDAEGNTEAEETLLLGMTHSKMLAPLVSAAIIVIVLVGVIWMAIPAPKPVPTQGYVSLTPTGLAEPAKGTETAKNKSPDVSKKPGEAVAKLPAKKGPEADAGKDVETLPVAPRLASGNPPVIEPKPARVEPKVVVAAPDNPSPERKAVGKLETKEMLLLQRPKDSDAWERVVPGKETFSTDTLMALPGNRCEIKLDSGVKLMLWGNLPQYNTVPILDLIMESRVSLFAPAEGFDGDFALECGRVFISASPAKFKKDAPPKVRIRFKEEVWDVTLLDPDTEVCIDLIGFYPEGAPFSKEAGGPSPITEFYLGLLKGRAELRVKFKVFPMLQAPTRVDWDSATAEVGNPQRIQPKQMEWWNKAIPDYEGSKQMQAAVASFVNRLSKPDSTRIEVIFFSAMEDAMEQLNRRVYSIYCLQALDAMTYLADAINDDHPAIRSIGIRAMQHWCSLAPDRDLKFYKLLIDKKSYTPLQALTVMQLTHRFSQEDQKNPATIAALFVALHHEKVAVRELAYQHLAGLDPEGAREVGPYDVAAEKKVVDAIEQKWKASWKKRFIDQKQ